MSKIIVGVIAVAALFMMAESLSCNECSFGLLGFCLSSSQVTCATNTSECFTGKATFTISPSVGFNTQGCIESSLCNKTTESSLLGVAYSTVVDCCSTDNCNPTQVSGAPSAKMSLTAALGLAVLASVVGSIL